MKTHSHSTRLRTLGFTLVEMIIVIAIISLLLTLVTPPVMQMLQGTRMNNSIGQLANELGSARMLAIRLNQTVEVRFFCYEDHESPGGGPAYRAYQIWVNGRPHQPVVRLDTGLVLATNPSGSSEPWSTILDAALNTNGVDQPLPVNSTSLNTTNLATVRYSFFQFRPDGSTNLPGKLQWTLTLLQESDANRAELPPNFASFLLDPVNGRVSTFRP